MPNALVLGGGMVGSVMAADLLGSRGWRVTLVDAHRDALERAVERCRRGAKRAPATLLVDCSSPREITRLAGEHDVVLGSLPSQLGFAALRAVIESGRPYADIAFMADDPLELDSLARRRGATAIVDCGVAPGMSNLLAGLAAATLRPCEHIDIMVGGLPVERRMPFQYKAAFSPADVIEEYTRPARIVEHGKVVVREALSEPELVDLPRVGTVEAFNTDGLRTLAHTLRVPSMRERTLRWPGHIDLMRGFRAAGFFSTEPVLVKGVPTVPRDVTAALLFPKWGYEEQEADLTVMRVIGEGQPGRQAAKRSRVRLIWDLFDVRDPQTGFTSMARTTAFPCTIVARLLAARRLRLPGVIPPERLATARGLVDHMLAELAKRGVKYSTTIELSPPTDRQ